MSKVVAVDINDLSNKLDHLEKNLNKDVFNMPIRESLLEIRNELLEYATTFEQDLKEFTNKGNTSTSNNNSGNNSELENKLKQAMKDFEEFKQKSNEEIKFLHAQNAKNEYRIKHLLKTIQDTEKESKKWIEI